MIFLSKPDIEMKLDYIYGHVSQRSISDLELFDHVISNRMKTACNFWIDYKDLPMIMAAVDIRFWNYSIPSSCNTFIDGGLGYTQHAAY